MLLGRPTPLPCSCCYCGPGPPAAGGLEPDLSNLTLPGGLSAAGLMAALGVPAECHGVERNP